MKGELYPGEFEAMEHNGRMDALESEEWMAEINKNLCDSCINDSCIFQTGIVRNHCDFYKSERKFEEIVVEYPPATYTEYIGKPYFSIKYEENGEHFIGFGTYKPEVLSMYLREYFIAPTIIEADKESEVSDGD